jgi:hypothetical protein
MTMSISDAQVEAAAKAMANLWHSENIYGSFSKLARAALMAAEAVTPCERCGDRGYVVRDVEWEPYAVQCECNLAGRDCRRGVARVD